MIEGAEKSEDHDMVGAVAKASGCWCHALRAFTYMFFGVAFNFPALSLKDPFFGAGQGSRPWAALQGARGKGKTPTQEDQSSSESWGRYFEAYFTPTDHQEGQSRRV